MWINDTKYKLLVNLAYLERGLAIGASDQWDTHDGDRIRIDLGRLTYHEARKAKRKFRKLHRQIKKEKIKKAEKGRSRSAYTYAPLLDDEDSCKKRVWYSGRCGRDRSVNAYLQMFDNSYGEKGHTPNKAQSRARRRDVYYYLKGKI